MKWFKCFGLVLSLLLTLNVDLDPHAAAASSDLEALLAFKNSSDPSNALSTWTHSSDPCGGSWLGVGCRRSRVTRLVLEGLRLRGPLHPLLSLRHLRLLSLKANALSSSSSAPLDLSPLPNLRLLYLSSNRLSGSFPRGLASLRHLRRLDLSLNRLSGPLPASLAGIPGLLTLRLEHNAFAGALPADLPRSLLDFNVSANRLVGDIPRPLAGYPASAFARNLNLCGPPLEARCERRVPKSDPVPVVMSRAKQGGRTMNKAAIVGIVCGDVAGLVVIVGLFSYCCYWRGRRGEDEKEGRRGVGIEGEMVKFEGCGGFERVEQLLTASAEMLGKGEVGTTYKVVLGVSEEGKGMVVVVKRVRERRRRRAAEVAVEGLVREVGGLRHDNVVALRAFYSSKDEMLLVYDFMPNGSLHSLLHGNRGPGRTPLDWGTRLKFVAGAAKGLAFLHTACESKLSHGHLTSSNILIDNEGSACITDFALNLLVPPLSTPPSLSSSPTKAYKAPELMDIASTSKTSQESDVYSFGVILLEVLTGKTVGEREEGLDLVEWVRKMARDKAMLEVFDLELLRHKMEEMVALLQVALLCLNHVSKERPKMVVVHKMIEDIRGRSAGHTPNDLSSNSSPCLSDDTPTCAST